MRVAVFATCLVDAMAPAVGQATVSLLERLGHEVVVPRGQTCCGQMHVNTGYPAKAIPIIETYVRAFEGADIIVAPSGSCVGSIRHQHEQVAADAGRTALAQAAAETASRTYELSQFLVDVLGLTDVGAYFPHLVTYHPACHSLRMLKVGQGPVRLLTAVDGLELVDLPEAETCCGFGGTFSLKNPDVSAAMVADKVSSIVKSGAHFATAVDAACLMSIGGGLHRSGASARTIHLAEILASTRAHPWPRATP